MSVTTVRKSNNVFEGLRQTGIRPGLVVAFIIAVALIFFEMFNYSTTDFALRDLLGDLRFVGIRWSVMLSIAFCAIDFAGIARLFTPEDSSNEPKEVWFLFGAWLMAATMNAALTWWGVSMAIANHHVQGTAVVDAATIQTVVPLFVAIMVWTIRILLIGTISVAGDKFLWGHARGRSASRSTSGASKRTQRPAAGAAGAYPVSPSARRAAGRSQVSYDSDSTSSEPTYHNSRQF
jgi:hypothetical protein